MVNDKRDQVEKHDSYFEGCHPGIMNGVELIA